MVNFGRLEHDLDSRNGGRYNMFRQFMSRTHERRNPASRSSSIQQNQRQDRRRRQREQGHINERTDYRNQRRRHNDIFDPDYRLPRWNGQRLSEMSTDYNYVFHNTLPGEEIMPDSGAYQNTQERRDLPQPLYPMFEESLYNEQDWIGTGQGQSVTSPIFVNGINLNRRPFDLNETPSDDDSEPNPPSPVEHQISHASSTSMFDIDLDLDFEPSYSRFETRSSRNSMDEGEGRSHWSRHHGGRYQPRRPTPRNDERRNLASRYTSIQQNQHHNQHYRQRDNYPNRNSDSSMHSYSERVHRNQRTELRHQRRPDYITHSTRDSGSSLPRRNVQRQSEMRIDSNRGTEVYSTLSGEELDMLLFNELHGRPSNDEGENIDLMDSLAQFFSSERSPQGHSATGTTSVNDFNLNSATSEEEPEPPSAVEHHDDQQILHPSHETTTIVIISHEADNQTTQIFGSISSQNSTSIFSGGASGFSAATLYLDDDNLTYADLFDDDQTYEDNLALGEQIGVVERGLHEETITEHLKTRKYTSAMRKILAQETEICVVCQDEYKDREVIGKLDCGHEYHANCIRKWLLTKNECPVCKQEALKIQ